MTKRAVVVGINDYSVQGFNNLRGCIRDAQAVYHLLIDAFLFDPSQVWLYTDARATSDAIRKCINYMLKVSEAGDVACLYYAGHGGLHPVTETTYYQTIIPYSGRFITDWDLFAASEQLRPSHVNFTIILDSCQSGGMHEESENPQGVRTVRMARDMIDRIVAAMKKVVPFGVTVPGPEAYRDNVSNVRGLPFGGVSYTEDGAQKFVPQAKSTLVAACGWEEQAGEFPDGRHGYFTQALLNLVNASNFSIDHRSLHSQLVTGVHALSTTQTPQLRGQENRMEEDFLQGWRDSR